MTRKEETEAAAKENILGWGENAHMIFKLGAEWADQNLPDSFKELLREKDKFSRALEQKVMLLEEQLKLALETIRDLLADKITALAKGDE
jgi:hypothetical protein